MSRQTTIMCGGTPTADDLATVDTFRLFLEDDAAKRDGDLHPDTFALRWRPYVCGTATGPRHGPWVHEIRRIHDVRYCHRPMQLWATSPDGLRAWWCRPCNVVKWDEPAQDALPGLDV